MKVESTRAQGAEVVFIGETLRDAETEAARLTAECAT